MATTKKLKSSAISCCPEFAEERNCNVREFIYRMTHYPIVSGRSIPVEVSVKARLEVCRGPMILGNLAYTTTLFPGEKVRLFTLDRRSKFTYDTETQFSYRHAQSHEEQYYMSAMSESLSELSVKDEGSGGSASHTDIHTLAEGSLGLFSASVEVNGNFNSSSSYDFIRELSRHARTSHYSTVQATRKSSSVSIGEVNRRTHVEGESESHYESSSRTFSNPNRCHAVTYYFYQIYQEQTVRFTIESIEKRVIDRGNNTKVAMRDPGPSKSFSMLSVAIPANHPKRLEIEGMDRASRAARNDEDAKRTSRSPDYPQGEPFSMATRKAALKVVDEDLMAVGLLDNTTRKLNTEVRKEYSHEQTTSLPTPGLFVKGCLDDCNVCEPSLQEEIQIGLERQKLENALLQRKIELLDKEKEYRCCPTGEEEVKTEDDT